MRDAVSLDAPVRERRLMALRVRARASAPTVAEIGWAVLSAALLIFSFPDFNLWPLAWVGLVPLLVVVARKPQAQARALLLGWIAGTLFFFGSCYWLTYAMVRYGGIPAWVAYPLLVPGALVLGLFPAIFTFALARVTSRWGARAFFVAPFLWVALEWARLGVTGQLWNAIGYSQAYVPQLIQAARWGGVYTVGFLIVAVNAAIAYLLIQRSVSSFIPAAIVIGCVTLITFGSYRTSPSALEGQEVEAVVIALQPNVPMDPAQSNEETTALVNRHLLMSESALGEWEQSGRATAGVIVRDAAREHELAPEARTRIPRVVIWPESPMNFTYTNDSQFRETVALFAARNHTSVLFNSLEPAPAGGAYNAAVMVNEEGRVVAQYDKIRLLPFGEYVPLPRWLPGANLIPAMVGDFTPGDDYTLMPIGPSVRTGVFICFESAFPSLARKFSADGADVLVNISNDGYLGPTPVMRQHLANAVFRAVENSRAVLRVTNTGITAYINERGEVKDATEGFQPAVRTWTIGRATGSKTFYTKHGDLFVYACAVMSILMLAATFKAFSRQRSAVSNLKS